MTDRSPYAVETTTTSLDILERLVEAETAVGVTRLASDLDLSKSVVHNHLSTLRSLGYVVKRRQKYRPSLRTLMLGEQTRESIPVYEKGRTKVENLADATGEIVTLFVLEENRGVPVCLARGTDEWTPAYRTGERMPLHVNAPGKAILSTFPSARVDALLDEGSLAAPTEQTVTDSDELKAALRKIRNDGIALCREEQFPGIVGVSAPINGLDDGRAAALGVVGPVDRLNGRYLEEDLTGQVVSTTKSIELALTA
ncbi:IclR family transcriptional regulator [Halomarina pelagica]|uniref:IclR family transcriptional regulator n=1 Tax=Halomarina pelagica TaxID=2961599 RepID=UPI0020C38958|nr:IclR family transcriptional regulator [Halomarina sp. BND7]